MLNRFSRISETTNLILDVSRSVIDLSPQIEKKDGEQLPLFSSLEAIEPTLFDLDEGPQTIDIKFSEPVSSIFRSRISKAWLQLHPSLQKAFRNRGVSVHVPSTPFEHTGTFYDGPKDVCGAFDYITKTIIVPELHNWALSAMVPNSAPYNTFYHEVGHAVDFCFDLSKKSGFQAAYNADKDSSNWDDDSRKDFQYFLWSYNMGQEAFAETWGQQTLKKLPDLQAPYDDQFEARFPRSWAWIEANAPSACNGFNLSAATINNPDGSGKTPLQVLISHLEIDEFIEVLSSGANPLVMNESQKSLIDLYIGWHEVDKVREMVIALANMLSMASVRDQAAIQIIQENVGKWRKFLTGWVGGETPESLRALQYLKEI